MTVPGTHASRVALAEAYVRERIRGHDSSHDWWHIHRVRQLALRLAADEGLPETERQLAELAALLHDVADHKYSADPEADRSSLQHFLATLALSQQEQEAILFAIDNLGFKEELARQQGQQNSEQQQQNGKQQQDGEQQAEQQQQEQGVPGPAGNSSQDTAAVAAAGVQQQRLLAVVQDADRLDAIGAIGIARCLTFGGRFDRVLHDPAVLPRQQLTQQQYTDKAAKQTTLNHFHEKLLLLKDLMRTPSGRRLAEERHAYMLGFLQQFHREWDGAA